MAVKFRLSRRGSKKKPFYRIVVADDRYPRDGRFIDMVGTYDSSRTFQGGPGQGEDNDLVRKGVRPTKTVGELFKREGVLGKA